MKVTIQFTDGSERFYENGRLTGTGKGRIVAVAGNPEPGDLRGFLQIFAFSTKIVGRVLR